MQPSTWYCITCGAANDMVKTNCFACVQPRVEYPPETPGADLLQGRYRLLTQVGVGGFGVVYKAIDTQSADRAVAVKQINLRGLTPQKMIEATDAFNREVEHLTPLKHPNLPRIYDHFTDTDHWYLVMEFIEGETLEYYLETRRLQRTYPGTGSRTLLPLEEIFPLAFQLCDVLTYLHTRHPPIIFRDVKPANVMHTGKGHLYLIDFGIARHFKPGQARDTTPLGSPGYAAPEQYGKAQTTPRTDLYSLGVLLHHLVTGEDPAETLFHFAPLPHIDGVDMQELNTLIRRMVDVDSDQRPVSASEVKEELQSMARLAANASPRIWYPPEGQTPSPSMAQDTFKLPSAEQQQVQLQRQQGTSRRRFLTRNVVGGAVLAIGTITVGPTLLTLFGSYGWHRVQYSSPGFPRLIQQPLRPAIAWSPDGKHAAFVSADGSFAQVYTIDSTGALVYLTRLQDKYFPGPFSALAWSPDNLCIATGNKDGNIDIWFINSKPGPVDSFPLNYPDYSGAIDTIAWSSDGKLIASSGPQRTLRVCDAQNGRGVLQQQPTAFNRARLLSWSPDSNHIVIVSDLPDLQPSRPSLQVWDVKAGKALFTFAEVARVDMLKVGWSPDGKTISSLGNDGNLYLWDASNGTYITTHWQTGGVFVDLLWSPDSKRIALETENGNLQVWHIQNNITTFYLVHLSRVRASIWLHDGRIALIDDTKTLEYINMKDI